MTPQEINIYIDKVAKEQNISRTLAEHIFWEAYAFVENQPQRVSYGYLVEMAISEAQAKIVN